MTLLRLIRALPDAKAPRRSAVVVLPTYVAKETTWALSSPSMNSMVTSITGSGTPQESAMARDVSHDAVVVVPGIMGSALTDSQTGKRIWGFDVRALTSAWLRRDGMLPLHFTPEERDGNYGRVVPTGLLKMPAWAPLLKGFEPYRRLVASVKDATVAAEAVLTFPYDWRLPVAVNGALLAEAVRRHLTAWRANSASRDRDGRPARLVFVAHSMGGLVVRAALRHAGDLEPDTRTVITLGTPFYGAVKTAAILNGNRSDPASLLPRQRMANLAATLPGVHDLLPAFLCVDAGLDIKRLTPADVGLIGGDKDLAAAALEFQQRLRAEMPGLPDHRAVVGTTQPTIQSMRLSDGVVHEQYVSFRTHADGELVRNAHGIPERRDRTGDGTVYRESASIEAPPSMYPSTQHGALANNADVLNHVKAITTEYDPKLRLPLGEGDIGVETPDAVAIKETWMLRLTSVEAKSRIECTVHDAETNRQLDVLQVGKIDGGIGAQVTLDAPGLYRLRVESSGKAPITQLVLAFDPTTTDDID
jgi:hypothetical protein